MSLVRVACILVLVLSGCGSGLHFPSASRDAPVSLSGILYRPDGADPFPAMVLLHTCAGLEPLQLDWAAWLKARGYVALVVDSFTPRGTRNVCREGRNPTSAEVGGDAFGALEYLRSLPFVDREHIGVMGWSFGANAALRVAGASVVKVADLPGGGFRVAVAFYPSCRAFSDDTAIPVLMLLGGSDDWTPSEECVYSADALTRRGVHTVEWKVYPGVTHGFDNPAHRAGVTTLGHFMKYDANAVADAEKRVEAFLATHLRGAR